MLQLDHIAIAATDLDAGVAHVEAALGCPMVPGGRHDRYGTHNFLLGLGDLYLEVIAPDPGTHPGVPRWFALDAFSGPPRPANWICRTDDLAAALAASPDSVGAAQRLERGSLNWQITVPDDGGLPLSGGWPTLLQWGQGITSPAATLPDRGCRLDRWEIIHPEASWLAAHVPLRDPRVVFLPGEKPAFRAHIDTPHGMRVLS